MFEDCETIIWREAVVVSDTKKAADLSTHLGLFKVLALSQKSFCVVQNYRDGLSIKSTMNVFASGKLVLTTPVKAERVRDGRYLIGAM